MWSHKFFCLDKIDTVTVPTSKIKKEAMHLLGLGEKILTLSQNATSQQLHEKIMKEFPGLESCGGYTLLKCCGSSKTLQPILPVPPGGHTPVSLATSLAQSRIYIRPLQSNVQLKTANTEVKFNNS